MLFIKVKNHINAILKKVWYKFLYGKNVIFHRGVTWRKGFLLTLEGEGNVEIGENCFFNNYCSINSLERVVIGKNTIFGENVKIYDHNHRFRDPSISIKEQGYKSQEVVIGNDCWIGSNVVILKGVHIGNHCIIGAGCVVDENIDDYTIVKRTNNVEKIKW